MELSGWDRETSPFHSGEQELQDRMDLKDHQERMARKIHRPYMPEQHRTFFEQLPFFVAGSVGQDGWPWASALFGSPGFVTTPSDRRLSIGGGRIDGDPFWGNANTDAPVGFLGIELSTRRRNRVNGVVSLNGKAVEVSVVQSYGNCPQYIHSRAVKFTRDPQKPFAGERIDFSDMPAEIADLVQSADTFFVASHNHLDDNTDTGGVDVSHRGGKPGFVKVDGNTLTVPDYIGNFAFNTLGNFVLNPKAGLLFIDFESGDLVQLTGTVELLLDLDDDMKAFRGTERAWRFHLDHGHILKSAAPLRWETGEPSPNALLTGDWAEATELREMEIDRATWRAFRIVRINDESTSIRSFSLKAADGKPLMPYKPGQFLTLRVPVGDANEPLVRNYTLSSAPSDALYRISVKREGAASQHLHDMLKVGDVIETRAPGGAFWLDTNEKRPAVLLAGGVGITPMISMARQALIYGFARRHHRDLTVIHAAQTTAQRAFAKDFSALQSASQNALRYISVVSSPQKGEEAGRDFHVAGRIDQSLLQSVLPLADYDFFLCGPPAFMQAIYDLLIGLGVRDARIFTESFGPASLTRVNDTAIQTEVPDQTDQADEAVVTFAASQFEQGWTSGDGTLLEFAEAHGLNPAFGCRGGSCGSCATKLIAGKVSYVTRPNSQINDDEVLICCAVPAKSDDPLTLDL